MKGPGLRIKFDAKRAWKCPACSKTVRLPGDLVSITCGCTTPPTWMQLLPDPPQPKFSFPRISIPEPEPTAVEFLTREDSPPIREPRPTSNREDSEQSSAQCDPATKSEVVPVNSTERQLREPSSNSPQRKERERRRHSDRHSPAENIPHEVAQLMSQQVEMETALEAILAPVTLEPAPIATPPVSTNFAPAVPPDSSGPVPQETASEEEFGAGL